MVLDFGEKDGLLFKRTDVRETPAGTATATAVGLTGESYVLVGAGGPDLTAERTLAGGTGITLNDGGVGANITINNDETAQVATNKTHVDGNGADHTDVASNTTHRGRTNDPHNVTKAQVDLSNVPNTNFTTPVGSNTTHRGSSGTDHSNVGSNNSHRTGNGNDHSSVASNNAARHGQNDSNTQIAFVSGTTKYYSIPGNVFHSDDPVDAPGASTDGSFLNESGFQTGIVGHLDLPHGAVITSIKLDGDFTGDTWDVRRINIHTGANSQMATAAVGTADTSITNPTVDNSEYAYFIHTNVTNDKSIWGATVTYTI